VCETFLEKIPTKNIVDHINRVRDDNNINNLHWVSQKENMNNKNKNIIKSESYKEIIQKYLIIQNDEEFKIINNSLYGNFSKYSISNYGKIKNNKNNKILLPTLTNEGYFNINLTNDNNSIKTICVVVHRLVCELFNKKFSNDNIVVNHIDEVKHNNYYKNLEWVTVEKNNQHSKNKCISMLDDNKNVLKIFDSIKEACKFLNKNNNGNIMNQLNKNKKAYGYYWKIN
jgi:hypothetical protein